MGLTSGRLITACAAVAFVIATAGALHSQSSAARPFVVAALRMPGRLLPIARFTGSEWVDTWPEPEDAMVPAPTLDRIPAAWLSGPISRTWTLWLNDDDKHHVDVVGTDRDAGGCSEPVTLRFDDVWHVGPSIAHIGLAVDTDQSIEGFRRLATSDREWRSLQPAIAETYLVNQSRLVAQAGSWLHDALNGVDIAELPLVIDALYRPTSSSAASTYYFVASKTTKDSHGLAIGLAASGWLQRDAAGKWFAFDLKGHTVSEEAGPAGVTPLGLFLLKGRTYWVVAEVGYESIGFAVFEITTGAARQIIVASGGGC